MNVSDSSTTFKVLQTLRVKEIGDSQGKRNKGICDIR